VYICIELKLDVPSPNTSPLGRHVIPANVKNFFCRKPNLVVGLFGAQLADDAFERARCCISNHMLQSWSPGSFRKSIDGPLDEVEVTFELGELRIRAAIPVALDVVTNFDSVLALDKGKRKADPSNSLKRTNSAHSNLAVVLSQISVHASSLQVVEVLGTPPRELARPE
jgi:hypothetical protein